ncbi:MAG TPA: SDR family oxidoreductase [Pyrinomonadaceae bacterium]|nr:SDR family oxidoreductase [Pyrinomonadaceae bacterium]
MRILVIGATGMLGHKLYQRLSGRFDVFGSIRGIFVSVERFGIFDRNTLIENVDGTNEQALKECVEWARPDCVINAAGVIKQVNAAAGTLQNLLINSVLPHRLACLSQEYDFRLITIGTDCVFRGKQGNYSEKDPPDARDVYGMTKLLGEVTKGNALTIRTSIIGRELASQHSLVEWFLSNREGRVKGYVNAIYSGFPTVVLADIIGDLIEHHPDLRGLYHVSSEPISKYDLLQLVNRHYRANVEIEPYEDYTIDRSLDSSDFRRAAASFSQADWDEMITQMAADPTPYDRWQPQMQKPAR